MITAAAHPPLAPHGMRSGLKSFKSKCPSHFADIPAQPTGTQSGVKSARARSEFEVLCASPLFGELELQQGEVWQAS